MNKYCAFFAVFLFLIFTQPARAQLNYEQARELYELTLFSNFYADLCNEKEVFLGSYFQNNMNYIRRELILAIMADNPDLAQMQARERALDLRRRMAADVEDLHEQAGCDGELLTLAKRHYDYLANTPTDQMVQRMISLLKNGDLNPALMSR